MKETLWERCVAFHGHSCPGLAIGFRAALEGMSALGLPLQPVQDEELVCVSENDACGVDAVQVLTGCTLGKGNLLLRPTGKMAFSFFLRESGRSVRVLLRPIPRDAMTREERRLYLLHGPAQELFVFGKPAFPLPERAKLFESRVCELCGESAPEHNMRLQNGKLVCLDCFQDYTRGWFTPIRPATKGELKS